MKKPTTGRKQENKKTRKKKKLLDFISYLETSKIFVCSATQAQAQAQAQGQGQFGRPSKLKRELRLQ